MQMVRTSDSQMITYYEKQVLSRVLFQQRMINVFRTNTLNIFDRTGANPRTTSIKLDDFFSSYFAILKETLLSKIFRILTPQ